MEWEYFTSAWLSLLTGSPLIIAWIIGVIFAARMFKRDGGPAERLLVAGCGLMLGESVLSPFQVVPRLWYFANHEASASEIGTFSLYTAIPLALISMAGIVCLVIAFWKRWQAHRPAVPEQTDQE